MAYLKPQSPLQHKDGDYFYPLTTADQVIMEDGSRLNDTIANLSSGSSSDVSVSAKTLTQHLSEESMVLSSLQYGDTLPTPGTPGRIFFLKVSE